MKEDTLDKSSFFAKPTDAQLKAEGEFCLTELSLDEIFQVSAGNKTSV